ncbi:SLAIN motif-containing protein 1a isoform X1 [Dunckerocampus dactyliophorus]|uniref:SLAIN motif-containing protein 1a isoform X1 n=1 Tax=Dunckerocampus dactyliophorus TaxID=161453 RepID=UPI0024055E77|nr:SLAIN motif-containing protein 1a isoform X1 [Dunckerocampus dactyliophorus]
MEAEVLLSPPVMADVNGNNKLANAELEVLKLQELVRKLEKQNEQLRTRANAQLPGSLAACLPAARDLFSAKCEPSAREPFAYFQPSSSSSPDAAEEEEEEDEVEDEEENDGSTTVLDEVDILDLSTVLPATEPDSWLYVSPRAKLQGSDSGLSPLQWCRQVLDHPGPEVELARMTLCHRLDQAKRWRGTSSVRPYSCIDGLSTLSCPVQPYTKPAVLTESTALSSAPLAASSSPSPGPPLVQSTFPLRTSCSLSDRAPTFLSNSALHNVGRQHAAISPQSSLDSEAGVSELEDDSISMGYKLQDITDVEVMARLQEESLRQDYASTSATASRRCSSFSLNSLRRSEVDLEEDDEEDEGYDQLPPPQPRLFRTGSMQRSGGGLPHSHTFSSFRDCRRSSNASTFSLAALVPYNTGTSGLSTDGHYRSSTDMKLRRSMPNLIRAPSMPSVPCLAPSSIGPPSHGPSSLPTMSSLRSSQSFDSSSGLARLQSSIPPPGQLSQRVQSVGNFPAAPRQLFKATAYVSPTVLQGPASLSTSTSLHSIPSSPALPQSLKPAGSSVPLPVKTAYAAPSQSAFPRSSLPRPASFVGISGVTRSSKISQPTRSMLTPPKSLASLSTLRDASWKDGCY